jgi:hypothetical protein
MQIKIKNLTNRTVLLRLNSGHTFHLAPRSTSSPILMQDVNGNAKIKKLKNLNVISLEENKDEKIAKPLIKQVKESPKKKDSDSKKVKTTQGKIKVTKT